MVDPMGHMAVRPTTVNINDGGGGSSEKDDSFSPPVSIYTGPGPVSIVLQDTTIKITAYVGHMSIGRGFGQKYNYQRNRGILARRL